MTQTIDPSTIAAAAKQLLEDRNAKRIATVQALADARAEREARRADLATAETADTAAYAAALRGGWTSEELASIGLDDPERKPGTRTRRARRPRAAAGSTTAANGAGPPAPAATDAATGDGAEHGADGS